MNFGFKLQYMGHRLGARSPHKGGSHTFVDRIPWDLQSRHGPDWSDSPAEAKAGVSFLIVIKNLSIVIIQCRC